MNFKRIIPDGTPRLNLLTTLLYLPSVLKNQFKPRLNKKKSAANNTLFVLGNGPSLIEDSRDHLDILKKEKLLVLNHFSTTTLFQELRPSHYLMADPLFWKLPDSLNDDSLLPLVDQINNTIFHIVKASWPIQLLLPHSARAYPNFLDRFNSDNVTISFFNATKMIGHARLVFSIYKKQLAMPSLQNVMIPSIMTGIALGYKNIGLLGFDHSWFKNLALTESNKVTMDTAHFYDKKKKPPKIHRRTIVENGQINHKRHSMATHFFALASLLDYYSYISQYANYRNVHLINCTSETYIDAFDRMALKDFIKLSKTE